MKDFSSLMRASTFKLTENKLSKMIKNLIVLLYAFCVVCVFIQNIMCSVARRGIDEETANENQLNIIDSDSDNYEFLGVLDHGRDIYGAA